MTNAREALKVILASMAVSAVLIAGYHRFAVQPRFDANPDLAVIDMATIYKALQNKAAQDIVAKHKELGPEATAARLAEVTDDRLAEKVGPYVEELAQSCKCVVLAKGGVMYGADTAIPDFTPVVMKKLGL
jgi:hypothetical protein